jgi:hypothetical protein
MVDLKVVLLSPKDKKGKAEVKKGKDSVGKNGEENSVRQCIENI